MQEILREKGKINVIEFGCGFGVFTNEIDKNLESNNSVVGVDISKTAVLKAKQRFPHINFYTSDIMNEDLITKLKPDVILLAEISWYILDKISDFLKMIKKINKEVVIIHLLTVYIDNKQQYGNEYFTNLNEICSFFDLEYTESGEVHNYKVDSSCKRTYFIGKFKSSRK